MKLKFVKKTIAAVGAAAMIATCMGGCGTGDSADTGLNKDDVLMTVGKDEVTLGEAYFMLKWQQAQYQTIGMQQAGEDWYTKDLFGTGESFQDYYKKYIIDILTRSYLAKQHMDDYDIKIEADEKKKIEETADNFLSDNVKSAQKAMMADKDMVEKILTNYTILSKMADKAVEDVKQDISEEELYKASYTRTYSYVYSSFESQTATQTASNQTTLISAEEQQAKINKLGSVREAVKNGKDFATAVSEAGLQIASHTYYKDNADDTYKDINAYMDGLAIGDTSEVIPLDKTGIIIAHMDSDNTDKLADEEVVTQAKEKILSERKIEMFQETVNMWKAETEVKLDSNVWSLVNMTKPIKAYVSNTGK